MKPKRTLSRLSRREREIMDVLFQMGRASAAEVHERIPSPPSYSAVRATLRILEEKGLLKHDHDGKRYIYRPALGQTQARRTAVSDDPFFQGATSGHHQYVRGVTLDCDGDALLVTVEQVGAACHTGTHSCFTDELPIAGPDEHPGEAR